MNNKAQVKGKLGSVVQIHVCTEFALLTLLYSSLMPTLYKRERADKKNHCVKQELEK